MKILKIIHGYPPLYSAGSEVYSQSLCNELVAQGHQVTIITREENPYRPDFELRYQKESDSLQLYYINMPRGKDGYTHREIDCQIAELISREKPELAHIGHLNHLSTGVVKELKKAGIPIVFTLHDFWLMCPRGQFLQRNYDGEHTQELCSKQEDGKCAATCYKMFFSGQDDFFEQDLAYWTDWISRRMQETREIVEMVDLFIAPSKYLMTRFIKDFGLPKEKISYLDYGFPTHYLQPTKKAEQQEVFTFGYIGTHIPAKGVNLLIEAFKEVKGKAVLKIWGWKDAQSQKALQQMIAESQHPIDFCGGYVNQNLADVVFSKVDAIVVPSIWAENSPLVIHEAQACHIPVITADFGGMAEYVQHLKNGLLFEHRSVKSLTNQLQWALEYPEKMQALGKRGYLYSEDGSVSNIEDHCKALIKLYQRTIPNFGMEKHQLWRITIDTNPEDCNLHCIMCEEHSPYSDFIENLYKETGVKRRRMPFEWIVDIFEQAHKLGVKEIIPSTMGEPLLYKGFEQIFDLSDQYGIKINLTTNGTFPKKPVEVWAKLIVPHTTDIKISWNAATPKTAQEVMLGIDFEQCIENVKTFIKIRDAHYKESGYFCRVTFQLTFMQNNMHELADIIKLAAVLGVDRVKGHQLWDHFEEIKELSFRKDAESIAQWNRYVEEAYIARDKYLKPNGEKVLLENIIPLKASEIREVPEHYVCPFLNKELWISATGKVSPCCAPDKLRQSLGDFGSIEDFSLEEVLNSDLYANLAQNYKQIPLCKGCNMRKPE